MRYPTLLAAFKKKDTSFRDKAVLDKRIRLFNGKVGCGSCHNPYSKNAKFLVIETEGGRLCLSCHEV